MSTPVRSYGGKTAQERAQDRRERLVDATIALLAEHGEAGTTMTAICARAGLTERYFYESFAHREDALLAALDHVSAQIAAAAQGVIEQTPGSPEERVHAVMASFVDLVSRDPALGLVAVVHSSATPSLRARRHELIGTFADLVAHEAAVLYGEDAWPADRARLQGLVYIAGFAELVASWLTGEVTLTAEQLTSTASDLFVSLSRRP
ncbi:MAG: TetR family transcriptional regulator [Marmoricola sp.]|nr:TetR family transcriptional regulator [Marmoricola sp.]